MDPSIYESSPPPINDKDPSLKKHLASKAVFIITTIIITVIVVAAVIAFILMPRSEVAEQPKQPEAKVEVESSGNEAIDTAAAELTDSMGSEADLMDSNDAEKAEAASESAAKIGESVDENSL